MSSTLKPINGEVLSSDTVFNTKLSFATRRQMNINSNAITAQFFNQNQRMEAQHLLASSALNNTLDEAQKAIYATQICPEYEAEFRYIVQQFAMSQAEKMRRI
jgi:hypothetical protein